MNILAHIYLSKGINKIMFGNFMGDFVKGNKFNGYNSSIKQGILLHRKIDAYTDAHSLHQKSRDRFRPGYRLHSGIVVDIIYDHFLAKNWLNYHNIPLEEFAQNVYRYIENNYEELPKPMQSVTPYIIEGNWLVLYRTLDGIERVLQGMARRTSMPNEVNFAMQVARDNYQEIESEFTTFFEALEEYSTKTLKELKMEDSN